MANQFKYILHIGHSNSKTNMLGSYLECKHKKQRIEVPLSTTLTNRENENQLHLCCFHPDRLSGVMTITA